jgi:hypothetical protein
MRFATENENQSLPACWLEADLLGLIYFRDGKQLLHCPEQSMSGAVALPDILHSLPQSSLWRNSPVIRKLID